jgi:hypothetical protein
MRSVSLFFLMLAVFEITLVIQMTTGGPPSSHIDPMIWVILAIGAIVGVPVIFLLFLFDIIATRCRFPFSALIYAALSVLCCAAIAYLIQRAKDRPTPTSVREWLAALVEFVPVLTAACVLLMRQVYRATTAQGEAD